MSQRSKDTPEQYKKADDYDIAVRELQFEMKAKVRPYYNNNNNNKSIYIAPWLQVTLLKDPVTKEFKKKLKRSINSHCEIIIYNSHPAMTFKY